MSLPVVSIAHATDAVRTAQLAELARRERKYRRRRLIRRIDDAIDECELANLAGAGGEAPPGRAAALVMELQVEADEPPTRPGTTQEALSELFRLQENYLLTRWFVDNDGDLIARGGDQ